MDENNLQVFLYVDSNKFLISVHQHDNFKNIYLNKFIKKNNQNELTLDDLEIFLNQNVYKIEKLLNTFIKNINLIIDHKDILSVNVSIKKNNNGDEISLENIKHALNEIKYQFKDSFNNKTIIHMMINQYLIDGKEFLSLPQKMKCKTFSLDVTFISLSNELIEKLEKICKKYQVSIDKFLSAQYVKKTSKLSNNEELFLMSKKIMEGFNDNEIIISSKITRKIGFFERFFQLFG